jgi:hypothetical protein
VKTFYSLHFKVPLRESVEANFSTILADGATDAALIKKEVIYIIFVDPDDFKPHLPFLGLKSGVSQDAEGITEAITHAFQDCVIWEKLQNIVFFLIRWNSGEHIKVFWCLSHRLELAIKDALKKDMEVIDTAMRDLFYTYQNSGKRLRELRALHEILNNIYEFENEEVKPTKSTGTRWIDHKLRAMKLFIDKRGLYLSHIQNAITTKKNDKAKLEEISRRIEHGSVLLKCAMYMDILEPA